MQEVFKRAILIALFAVSAAAGAYYSYAISGPPAAKDRFVMADAIVVLTGGRGRVDEGLRLLREGASGILILSGVNEESDADSIYAFKRLTPQERGNIILDKASRTTHENAVQVKRLVSERGYGSIILITSWYHMRRAETTFRRELGAGMEIRPYAVASVEAYGGPWSWAAMSAAFPEFLKYCWFKARFTLEGGSA